MKYVIKGLFQVYLDAAIAGICLMGAILAIRDALRST